MARWTFVKSVVIDPDFSKVWASENIARQTFVKSVVTDPDFRKVWASE